MNVPDGRVIAHKLLGPVKAILEIRLDNRVGSRTREKKQNSKSPTKLIAHHV